MNPNVFCKYVQQEVKSKASLYSNRLLPGSKHTINSKRDLPSKPSSKQDIGSKASISKQDFDNISSTDFANKNC